MCIRDSYLIDQIAIDAGGVINSVTVTASSTGGVVSDTSDNGIDNDGNTTDDVTVLAIPANPLIEATKTVSITDNNGNGTTDLGDLLTYTITFENKGNVTLSGLTISDTLTDGNNQLLTLTTTPTFVSATTSSTSTTLQVSGVSTYTATYQVNQQAVDSGQINNTVLVTASSPGQTNNVTDRSDDGDDSDGDTDDDATIITITASPSLEVTKTASVTDINANGITDKDDNITYSITIKNNGNVTLNGLTLVDTLIDGNNTILSLDSGPTFASASAGSNANKLLVSGVATFTADYTIRQGALDSGRVLNSVLATASSPGQTNNVSDLSLIHI